MRREALAVARIDPAHPPRWLFPSLLAVSAVAGAVVVSLGENGELGGGIAGTYPPPPGGSTPPRCEGGAATASYWFSFVAGVSGRLSFNGTVPGPCVRVGNGSSVTVTLTIDPAAGVNHSWEVIGANASYMSAPIFPGAGWSNQTRFTGTAPGTSVTFHFVASPAGTYRYLCEVPGHADAGMYGWFYVVAPSSSLSPTGGPALEHHAPPTLIARDAETRGGARA